MMRSVGLVTRYGGKLAKKQAFVVTNAIARNWEKASPQTFKAARAVLRGKDAAQVEDPIPPYGSVVEVDGFRIRIDPRMAKANIRKLMAGKHVLQERKILDLILEPGDRMVELGGGIGMVAIAASRAIGSENVTSFEANPALEEVIRENYRLNNVSPTLRMCMVGPEASSRTFYVAKKFSRSSVYDPDGEDTTAVDVPVVPFNDELMAIKPNVLVIDIQGAEVELIDYADFTGVEKLAIEFHPSMTGVRPILSMRRKLAEQHGFEETHRFGNSFVYRKPS
ncbi:FkbM family methyltransferase [Parvularcula lutaonensis]|nr:FkbM family methyltransferase [Parvularcula lutaonensis]